MKDDEKKEKIFKKDYFTHKMIGKNHKRREKEEKKKQKENNNMSHQIVGKPTSF